MPNSISNKSNISIQEYQPSRAELTKDRDKLTRNINCIKSEITADYDQPIKKKQKILNSALSTLKKVKSFAADYGNDTVIRLKGDKFKKGEASGFFNKILNGDRYQTERQAAAKIGGLKGDKVSASQLKAALNEKIANSKNELAPLNTGKEKLQTKLDKYMSKLSNVEGQIRGIASAERSHKKENEGNIKNRNDFSMIYQSNAGCKALNAQARFVSRLSSSPGKLDSSAVVNEYKKAHGDEIFTKGNKELKSSIQTLSSNLKKLVETGTQLWYTPTDKNITTHRGQGMTSGGIEQLRSQFNKDKNANTSTVYALGQFFSTSTIKKVAQDFAKNSQDEVKVMFNVEGNSASGIFAQGGLDFNNAEGEKLYSPIANFKVNNIEIDKSGIYQVSLQEVPKQDNSQFLPY